MKRKLISLIPHLQSITFVKFFQIGEESRLVL